MQAVRLSVTAPSLLGLLAGGRFGPLNVYLPAGAPNSVAIAHPQLRARRGPVT
jgi:hypothetical protein